MILFHDVIEILRLTDDNRGAMLRVVAVDGGFVGRTPINRERLGHPTMPTDRLGQKPLGSLLVTLRGEEKVDRLPVLVAA